MKRIMMMILLNLVHFPDMVIRLFRYSNHPEAYPFEERYGFVRQIVEYACKSGRVNVEGYGLENIPRENGFILYPNHQGMFDILAIMHHLNGHTLRVVMKQELTKVPVLKRLIKLMEALAIDRSDARQGMKVILQVAEDVKKGENYLIFAEGTRSRNGNKIQEFKGGSFKSATKAKAPIVPVALVDCFKPFDTGTISQVTVQVHFLEPICYEEYKDMKTTQIAAMVKERIEQKISSVTNE